MRFLCGIVIFVAACVGFVALLGLLGGREGAPELFMVLIISAFAAVKLSERHHRDTAQ